MPPSVRIDAVPHEYRPFVASLRCESALETLPSTLFPENWMVLDQLVAQSIREELAGLPPWSAAQLATVMEERRDGII